MRVRLKARLTAENAEIDSVTRGMARGQLV